MRAWTKLRDKISRQLYKEDVILCARNNYGDWKGTEELSLNIIDEVKKRLEEVMIEAAGEGVFKDLAQENINYYEEGVS